MPNNPDLQAAIDALTAKVTNAKGVMNSAQVFIEGFNARLDAAIQSANDAGASVEELAPIQAEADAMQGAADALAAAIAANP